jgi:hypothetical protein
MTEAVEIEPQGDHQFVVRLSDRGASTETWVNLTPAVLAELGVRPEDEEGLVRRTVAFLLRHQEVADFPTVVELEDVAASYADYRAAVRAASER